MIPYDVCYIIYKTVDLDTTYFIGYTDLGRATFSSHKCNSKKFMSYKEVSDEVDKVRSSTGDYCCIGFKLVR